MLVVPVVGDDDDGRIAGTPPLHQLLTTPFASIPHLHPVLGVGADDVGGEAREGKDKKAKKDMSKDLSLPTPDSLESGNLVGQQHLSQACLHQSFQTTVTHPVPQISTSCSRMWQICPPRRMRRTKSARGCAEQRRCCKWQTFEWLSSRWCRRSRPMPMPMPMPIRSASFTSLISPLNWRERIRLSQSWHHPTSQVETRAAPR